MRRTFIVISSIVAILAAAWAGGWFWLAAWAESKVPGLLADITERGVQVDCPERDIVGFPFALRLACGEAGIADAASGTEARLAGVTGGASVFAPMTAEVTLDSPAQVASPLLEEPAELRWHAAEFDVAIGMNGPRGVSFEAADFSAQLPLPEAPETAVAAADAGGSLAPSSEGGTDLGMTFTDLAVTTNGATLPPVSGTASGHLSVPPRDLVGGAISLDPPLTARNIAVSLESNGARLDAAGDVSIDAEGVVDGRLTLLIAGADALPAFIAALPPESQKIGNAVVGGLFMFGTPTTLDGEPASELTVEIERGVARVGPVEIALPRLPVGLAPVPGS
jgi:hypothetical protein